MGAACCCLRDDFEDFINPNSAFYRNCMCLRCCLQYFIQVYASLFHRGEQHVLVLSSPGATSLNPMGSMDSSFVDMFHPPPRPLPYDADPRYFRLQRDGLVSRREKGSSHLHEETEPFRSSETDDTSESLNIKSKWSQFNCEEDSRDYNLKSSHKFSTVKSTSGYTHIHTSSEDEDVCPTCLDEYTSENPKIITNCAHHFHLGCIYEWMERSDRCPVCGKVMAFDETSC